MAAPVRGPIRRQRRALPRKAAFRKFHGTPAILRMAARLVALPRSYVRLVNWKECSRTRWGVVADFLYLFFRLRSGPEHYSPCRLDEKPREEWSYYYGSTYGPHPRMRLRREVARMGYRVIFNDKSVSEVVCRGIGVRLPRYFGVLRASDDHVGQIEAIFRLDPPPQKIIIKPIAGSAGRGIAVAGRGDGKPDGDLIVRTGASRVPLRGFRLEGDAIVQEYITQHPGIAAISSCAVNTIRVLTLWTKGGDVLVMSAAMRFGVGGAPVDNWSAGGVAVGVDHRSGRLMRFAYDKQGNRCESHPDTQFRFEGFELPFWPQVVEMAKHVQRSLNFYRLIGVDVAITADGPVLVEMNANPDTVFQEQTAGPLLRDARVLRALHEYGLLYNRKQLQLARRLHRNPDL